MKIANIKTFAWERYEKHDPTFGFDFNGKRIIYPWLDAEKECFELSTVQAIDEYGLENIKRFCEAIVNICPCKTQTFAEWLGGDATGATEGQMRAYRNWCEDEVEYYHGKLIGLNG